MRGKVLAFTIAGAAFAASPAMAEGPYVEVDGGLFMPSQLSYDFIGLESFFKPKFSKGYAVSGKLGYDFEGLRIEFEGAYNNASANRFGFQVDGQNYFVAHGKGVSGSFHTLSGMANVYYDISQSRFRPYVGAGVGITKISVDSIGYTGVGSSGTFLDGSDAAISFQLMAGAKFAINDHLLAGIGYRYFDVEHASLKTFAYTAHASLRSSTVMAGLTYSFGHPMPPLPVPPPVAAATPEVQAVVDQPQPVAVQAQTSYVVEFPQRAATLDPQATAALDSAVSAYQQTGHAAVVVSSNAEQAGPSVFNERLAQQRASRVRTYLVAKKVPASTISVQDFDVHEVSPSKTPVSDDARSFDISFGVGSGN